MLVGPAHNDALDETSPVAPQSATSAERRRLSAPGLRTFKAIAADWQLSEVERLAVLGQPPRSTYHAWMAKADAGASPTLALDTLLRISAVLGIHKALQLLFEDSAEARVWLRGPHQAPLFGGQAPMDLITSGTQDGLLQVRRYLDGWRGGIAAPPSPDVTVEPITADDLVHL